MRVWIALVCLLMTSICAADTTVTDNSAKNAGNLSLLIITDVQLTEEATIDSRHSFVVKREDATETEVSEAVGTAFTRAKTLLHSTSCIDSNANPFPVAKLKKGDVLVSRAKTTINGIVEMKDKVIFVKK